MLPDASSLPIFIAKTPHHHHHYHHPSLPLGEVPDCIAKENKFKQCHRNGSLDGTKSICTVCMSWMWFFLETVFLSIFSPSVLSFIPNICFSSHYFFSLMLPRSFSNNVNVHSGVPFLIFSPSHPALSPTCLGKQLLKYCIVGCRRYTKHLMLCWMHS